MLHKPPVHQLLLAASLTLSLSCTPERRVGSGGGVADWDSGVVEDTQGPPPVHRIEGRVVTPDGAGIEGATVTACNDFACTPGDTDEEGNYRIQVSENGPYKMELFGGAVGAMSSYYYQEVADEELALAAKEIIAMPVVEELLPWPEASGGKVTVAGGALELEAPPGDLIYPLGADEAVSGAPLGVAQLPPYDQEPWTGLAGSGLAFHLNPVGTKCREGSLSFSVFDMAVPEGTRYTVWSVDPSLGTLRAVGTATADAAGVVVSDDGGSLKELTTLILVAVEE